MTKTQTKTKKSKGILRTITLCIVGIFLGVNLYLFNAHNIVGNALPMPFGYGAAVVLSGSMEPELSINDLIFVKQTEDFEIGDVVVFQESDDLVVHRIINIDEHSIQTKGDANNASDGAVEITDIKGKVVACIPFIGIVINMLKTPLGIISVLVLAFLLLELSYMKDKSKDEEELEQIKVEIERMKEKRNDSAKRSKEHERK